MYMLNGSCIADAINLPCLLLYDDGQQLDLMLPSWRLSVLHNLPAASLQHSHSGGQALGSK
jgi:hypothetical protein